MMIIVQIKDLLLTRIVMRRNKKRGKSIKVLLLNFWNPDFHVQPLILMNLQTLNEHIITWIRCKNLSKDNMLKNGDQLFGVINTQIHINNYLKLLV